MALLAIFAGGVATYQGNQGAEDAQATETATVAYPDHLINGDFEYWGVPRPAHSISFYSYAYISLDADTYLDSSNSQQKGRLPLPSTFNKALFAWRNTTTANNSVLRPGDVQLNNFNGNSWVDLLTAEAQKAIYQDVATTPGSVYKWSLKHSSTNTDENDRMSVLIGPPSNPTRQQAYRTASPGANSPLGLVGTEITTKWNANEGEHKFDTSYWDIYEGTYIVPAGQTLTRFTFEDLNGTLIGSYTCNWMDDVTFTISDPLQYNLNGGTGNLPKPQASGTYPGYYQRDSSVTLSDIVPTREGYTFLGWSDTRLADIESAKQYEELSPQISMSHTMYAGTNTVYAVWAKNPIVTFIDNITGDIISEKEIPFNTELPETAYPTPPAHDWYDFTGYTPVPDASIREDITITLDYVRNDIISVPASIEWHDNENWAKLRPDSVILALYADNVRIGEKEVSEKDGWETSFDNLYIHNIADGHVIDYRVVRESGSGIPDNYDTTDVEQPTGDATGLLVNAVYIATVNIPITKIWDDMNDVYGERPENIEVVLNKNGAEYQKLPLMATGDESKPSYDADDEKKLDEWHAEFVNVPLWDEDEQMIDWTIEEVPVYGYDFMGIVPNGAKLDDGFTMTNRIWKHIEMPETGTDGIIWIWIISGLLVMVGAAGIVFKRGRRK